MLLYILLGLLGLIAVIVIAASTKPNTVHYERSTVINAAPDAILAHITDFHKWAPWSPWEKMDPDMQRTFSGAASGPGAKYGWTGNNKVGEGAMEITEVSGKLVRIHMHFIRPMNVQCDIRFSISAEGAANRLTWTMDGPNTFMGKVFSVFVNMDKMIGKDFEAGLAALKQVAERN